jgi:hypothetical protein
VKNPTGVFDIHKDLEKKEKKKDTFKKFIYYVDEFSIFLFSIAAVVLADAIGQRIKGKMASVDVVFIDWLNVLVSVIIAVISYGSSYTVFKYNDKEKPSYVKRVSAVILQGIAWRTVVGWKDAV